MTQADDDKLGGLVIDEEIVLSSSPSGLENSLRLLARWLVSAARKGAPAGDGSPPADPHNPLDVAADLKVGLDRG